MAEVRVQAEGSLWWVQASGSGRVWATASAPQSGLVAFCTDFSFKSAFKTVQVMDRGTVDHHKLVGKPAIEVSFGALWTGSQPNPGTASGASLPMVHLEFKAARPEIAAASGFYYQFYGVPLESVDFAEAEDGDTLKYTVKALGMNGPTASGYIS